MEKIWTRHYQSGVPETINTDRFTSIVQLLEESFSQFGQRIAFENFGSQLTYQQIDDYSSAFAHFLRRDLGLDAGDRVAVMMPNLLQYPIAMYGILRAGLVVVNTNPLYTAEEVTHQLNDAGAKAIVVLANCAHKIAKALPKLLTLQAVVITQLGDLFPTPKRQWFNFAIKYLKRALPAYDIPQAIAFREAITQGQQTGRSINVKVEPNDIAFLQYTGGTTGVAKAAVLTHRNLIANVLQATSVIEPMLRSEGDIIVTALPLYHIFSLTANCLIFTQIGAKNILITDPRNIASMIRQIRDSRFTAITGVNTLFQALVNHPKFSQVDFSCLTCALSGGMGLQRTVAEHWQQITRKPILEAYGLTETSPAVTMNPADTQGFNGSIGIPVPSTDIDIIDEQGRSVPLGEVGELCVRGPQVMQGYWQRPIETANVLNGEGWLRTGDLVRMGDHGFLYLVDRKKDMIIVSGFNVYPQEVENIISLMPQVAEVGVVGVEHPQTGERVKACIVKRDQSLDEKAVVEHCRQHLTGYKIPKIIEFVSELSKTNVGKVMRRSLKG